MLRPQRTMSGCMSQVFFSMKRKVASQGDSKGKLANCLNVPGASETAVLKIWNNLHSAKKQKTKGTFIQEVKEHLQPARDCFDAGFLLPKNPEEDEPIPFPVANLQKLLNLISEQCPSFRHGLRSALQQNGWCLRPVLYADECTPLNVLLPTNKMKATLFYISFLDMDQVLSSELAWLPLAFILHDHVDVVSGGMAGTLKKLVEHLHEQNRWGFSLRFDKDLHWCKLGEFFFHGDLDSIRSSFALKGSAGLRPCPHCNNIIKKGSNLIEFDDEHYFLEISSGKENHFQKNSDQDVFQAIDSLARQANDLSKMQLKDLEKRMGLNMEPESIWFDANLRSILPPSRIIYDPMHVHYSNGIANVELALLFERMEKQTPFNKGNLLASCLQADWKCHGMGSKPSKSHLRLLFSEKLFGDYVFKGSACQTKNLVSLMAYYVEILLKQHDFLPEETQSFLSLVRCHRELTSLKQHSGKVTDVTQMRAAAQNHQDLFHQAYENGSKPKHHFRFHIADSALRAGKCISCEPQEKKHQVYKESIAARVKWKSGGAGGGVAWATHPRILSMQIREIKEHPLCFEMTLLPPLKTPREMQCNFLQNRNTPMSASDQN